MPYVFPARFEHAHAGRLAPAGSFASVESAGESVIIGALKRAEDGDGVILRLVETAGEATRATVRLPAWGRTIEASLGAHEILTLFLPDNPVADVREVNLIEWE